MMKAMTVGEAMESLGMSRNTLYKTIKNGEIFAWKVGREYRLSSKSVAEWIVKNSVGGCDENPATNL